MNNGEVYQRNKASANKPEEKLKRMLFLWGKLDEMIENVVSGYKPSTHNIDGNLYESTDIEKTTIRNLEIERDLLHTQIKLFCSSNNLDPKIHNTNTLWSNIIERFEVKTDEYCNR